MCLCGCCLPGLGCQNLHEFSAWMWACICLLPVLNFDLVCEICLSNSSSLWNPPVSMGVFLHLCKCPQECVFSCLWIGICTRLQWTLVAGPQVPLSLGSKALWHFPGAEKLLEFFWGTQVRCYLCYIWLTVFLCRPSIFDTGSWEHLRQNVKMFWHEVACFQNLRVLR